MPHYIALIHKDADSCARPEPAGLSAENPGFRCSQPWLRLRVPTRRATLTGRMSRRPRVEHQTQRSPLRGNVGGEVLGFRAHQ
jgi:hypothetical protein